MTTRQTSLFAEPTPGRRDQKLTAPFPYFGGKSPVSSVIWYAFGDVKQYIEPFCGSLAVLFAASKPAHLEVVGDANAHLANFWRAVKFQPEETWAWSDYPVSHIDLAARHRWLAESSRYARLVELLADPEWPGDSQCAGWWVWGQCCWIGSGWCEPHVSTAGMGLQAHGQIPHVSDAGRGLSPWQETARSRISALSFRLERVRIIHGEWDRGLNHHYGGRSTAIFLDPPYAGYDRLYGRHSPVALEVADWAREERKAKIALCGHVGDYDLPGWEVFEWTRPGLTYGGSETTGQEAIWFSPSCRRVSRT